MKNYFLISTVILSLCLYACSSETEGSELISTAQNFSDVITSIDEMPTDIQNLIAKAEPYISPEMQQIISSLDTITTILPVEEVFPFLFSEEISTQTLSTRASSSLPTTTFTGYYSYETIFNPITIKLTAYSSSALRQSLVYGDETTLLGSGPYSVKFFAVTLYAYFPSGISQIIPMPTSSDFIGINPDKLTSSSNISNDTSLSRGFAVNTLSEGFLYSFTTYALEFTVDGTGTALYFPIVNQNMLSISNWGRNLEWTAFTI